MTSVTQEAFEQLDYPFLLVTHMVCADQQIHSKESKALCELASQTGVGQSTINEMEKILTQDHYLLPVDKIARKIRPGMQSEAMRQILAIAYVDGFFSPLERQMLEQVAQVWHWSTQEIQKLLEEAEGFTIQKSSNDDQQLQSLPFGARLLKGANSLLSRSLVDKLAEIAPENIGRKIEQLQREILLSGPEYDEAIRQCAVIAREDFNFAETPLKSAHKTLYNLAKGIQNQLQEIQIKTNGNAQAKTAGEVAKQLEITRKAITVEIIKEIESVRESLVAKQRALNHFSIAFMGRTKAGKSTLHAIITGEGWDGIGIGKQRTTRFNRVYEWKNIRIIDTPGIGAPDGKTDEEIAQGVIEESDVICYVVTNDSIQETEFKFLKLLKEKAKPLIILLNVKSNIREPRRLEYFLKNPDKLFALDGNSGLGGHIERIRRYAQEHYANDYFDIIPVMLEAARMSREPEHQHHKEQLFKASRIQNFLDSIRISLLEYGAIRRSQTLLGSTAGAINNPQQWVTQQFNIYQEFTETLKTKRKDIQKQITSAAKDNKKSLRQQIEAIFQDVINAIPSFAEDHWNSNEISLKLGWEQNLQELRFSQRLDNAYKQSGEKFIKDVQEAIEEVGNELQVVAQFSQNNDKFNFSQQDSSNFRDLFRIGGSMLGIAGIILTFVAPPVGIAMGIAATIFSMMTGLFKSKEEQRHEAVQNISISLTTQVNTQREIALQQSQIDFSKYCASVQTNIETYFDKLIAGLDVIAMEMESAKNQLNSTANDLNCAYAKRIIDWCTENYEPLTNANINRVIGKVKRKFGYNLDIQTKSPVKIAKSQDTINRVLQENTSIHSLKP